MKTNEKIIKEKAERAKEIFDKAPILDGASQPFKEGVFQGIQLGLMEPVQSPSEWIVEVDGKKKGTMDDQIIEPLKSGLEIELGDNPEKKYKFKDHHIRLLTKDGGVVMDNRKE